MDVTFPDGFLFGTATAAHQIEGANWNTDWWRWEHAPASPCVEPSGDACDSYHRFEEDIALVADLGLDAYRFSVEWARIEPEEGEFSSAQLEHYRRVAGACRQLDVTPIVTLQHFTLPRWLADAGGWTAPRFPDRFARYSDRVAATLGDVAGWFCTINEVDLPPLLSYEIGVFPPGIQGDREAADRAFDNVAAAHDRAVEAVRSHSEAPVGMTLSMWDVQYVDGADPDTVGPHPLARAEDRFLEQARDDDFLGVQVYSRMRMGPEGPLGPEDGVETTQMGYEFWPQAVEAVVRRAWERTAGTPLFITENGIGTADDARRVAYLRRALEGVGRCLDDGIDLRGYLVWSLLDNFEWTYGYGPTFGLFEVDRATFERTAKPSAAWYGQVARSRSLGT